MRVRIEAMTVSWKREDECGRSERRGKGLLVLCMAAEQVNTWKSQSVREMEAVKKRVLFW